MITLAMITLAITIGSDHIGGMNCAVPLKVQAHNGALFCPVTDPSIERTITHTAASGMPPIDARSDNYRSWPTHGRAVKVQEIAKIRRSRVVIIRTDLCGASNILELDGALRVVATLWLVRRKICAMK